MCGLQIRGYVMLESITWSILLGIIYSWWYGSREWYSTELILCQFSMTESCKQFFPTIGLNHLSVGAQEATFLLDLFRIHYSTAWFPLLSITNMAQNLLIRGCAEWFPLKNSGHFVTDWHSGTQDDQQQSWMTVSLIMNSWLQFVSLTHMSERWPLP